MSLFVSAYLATFVLIGLVPGFPRYWAALCSAVLATGVTIGLVEKWRWRLGLAVPPLRAFRDLAAGALLAGLVVGSADLLIAASTTLRHVPAGRFPWTALLVVYLPAAVHEELLFRGYPFQRIRSWNRPAAIALCSSAFALLHSGNVGVTPLAIVNLALAGVLLALAYEATGSLWMPIGIHAAWNVLSGPLLGYAVSGYDDETSLLALRGGGPGWLTGGAFGIEASLWMLPVELAAVAGLLLMRKRRLL